MQKKEVLGKENHFSSDPELRNIEQDLAEINERLKRLEAPGADVLPQALLKQKEKMQEQSLPKPAPPRLNLPQISVPKMGPPKPILPKINWPKLSLPKINYAKIFTIIIILAVIACVAFFIPKFFFLKPINYENPIFTEKDFLKDELKAFSTEQPAQITLPNSGLVTGDFLKLGRKEYPINESVIEDILIRKYSSQGGNLKKINYAFKNIGRDKKISFVWKTEVSEQYTKANNYPLSQDFVTDASTINFYSGSERTYYLTFEDMKKAFGAITIYYDAATRILTAESSPKQLQRNEEMFMDPGGSNVDTWPTFHHDFNRTGFSTSSMNMTEFGLKRQYVYEPFSCVGSSSSPAVMDDIVVFGSICTNTTYALNSSTGIILWNYTTAGAIYSSPTISQNVVYIASDDGKLYALNATTGLLIWNKTIGDSGSQEITVSPAVINGILYTGTDYDNNPNNRILALNASNGSLIWEFQTNSAIDSKPAVINGVLYVGSGNPDYKLFAINISTGTNIWNYTAGNQIGSTPAVIGERIFFGSQDNKMYALNSTTGEHLWNYTVGNIIGTSPAVVTNSVYFGSDDNKTYALNSTIGTHLWNYTTGGRVLSSPAVADGIVYIGSNDRKIHGLNATTGVLVWSYNTLYEVSSSPAIVDGTLYTLLGTSLYAFTSGQLPSINSVSIKPTTVYADEPMNCTFNVSSNNMYSLQVNITWFNGSTRVSAYDYSYAAVLNNTVYNSDLGGIPANVVKNNESWKCNITVSYLGGSKTANSNTATIGISPYPIIKSIATVPSARLLNRTTFFVYLNISDDLNETAWVNYTLIAPNGSKVITNANATWHSGDLWNTSSYVIDVIGTWTYIVNISDEDNNMANMQRTILMMNLTENLAASTVNYSASATVYGVITLSNGSAVANQPVGIYLNGTALIGYVTSWYSGLYLYRLPINLTENSGANLSAYQIKVLVNTSYLIGRNKMRPDCADIRFTDEISNLLPHWIESGCNTTSTKIWFNTNLTASQTAVVFMYYGYSSAQQSGNASAVFVMLDDFENGVINWSNYTTIGHESKPRGSIINITSPLDNSTTAMQVNISTGSDGNCNSQIAIKNFTFANISTNNWSIAIYTKGFPEGAYSFEYVWLTPGNESYIDNDDAKLFCVSQGSFDYCTYNLGRGINNGRWITNDAVNTINLSAYWPNRIINRLSVRASTWACYDTAKAKLIVDNIALEKNTNVSTTIAAINLSREETAILTNASGQYLYTFTAPGYGGVFPVRVNLTYGGVFGENEKNLTVLGHPIVTYLNITPQSPTESSQLNCSFNITGAGNNVNVSIAWLNGSNILTAYNYLFSSITVGALYNNGSGSVPENVVKEAEQWKCNITATDGITTVNSVSQAVVVLAGNTTSSNKNMSLYVDEDSSGYNKIYPCFENRPNLTTLDCDTSGFPKGRTFWKFYEKSESGTVTRSYLNNVSITQNVNWSMFGSDYAHTGFSNGIINSTKFGIAWTYEPGSIAQSNIVVSDNRVYYGTNPGIIFALNLSTGAQLWNYTANAEIMSNPGVDSQRIFFGTVTNYTYAVNLSNGVMIWNRSSIINSTVSFRSGFTVLDQKVYFGDGSGIIYALNVSNGTFIWNRSVADANTSNSDMVYSTPAVYEEKLYIPNSNGILHVLNLSSGQNSWNITIGNPLLSSAVVINGRIYIGAHTTFYCVNASSRIQLWNYTINGNISASAAFANNAVFFGTQLDNKTYALNASNGVQLWNYSMVSGVTTSAVIMDSLLLLADQNNYYLFNITSGAQVWNMSGSPHSTATAAIADSAILLPIRSGQVYVVRSSFNTPPTVNTAQVLGNAVSHEPLNCTFNVTDYDTGDVLRVNISWSNGTNRFTQYDTTFNNVQRNVIYNNASLMLPANITLAGNVWGCFVGVEDGYVSTNTVSSNVTIQNTPPTLNSIRILPTTAYTNQSINCSFNFTDIESTNLTVRTWWINITPSGANLTWWLNNGSYTATRNMLYNDAGTNLSHNVTKKNEAWRCAANVTDGNGATIFASSANITISNTPPVLNVTKPEGDNTTNSIFQIEWNATDIDAADVSALNISCYADTNTNFTKELILFENNSNSGNKVIDLYEFTPDLRYKIWCAAADDMNVTRAYAPGNLTRTNMFIVGAGIIYPNPGNEVKNKDTITVYANITFANVTSAFLDCRNIGGGVTPMSVFEGSNNYSAQCTLLYEGTEGQFIYINATNLTGATAKQKLRVNVDNTPPLKVSGLSVVSSPDFDGSINLSWSAAADAVYYKIYRSKTSGFDAAPGFNIANTTLLNYTDVPGEEGTFYYRVSAVDNVGWEGAASDINSSLVVKYKPAGEFSVTPSIFKNSDAIKLKFVSYRDFVGRNYTVSINLSQIDSTAENLSYLLDDNEDNIYNLTYVISSSNNYTYKNATLTVIVNDSGQVLSASADVILNNVAPGVYLNITSIGAPGFPVWDNEYTVFRSVFLAINYSLNTSVDKCRFKNDLLNYSDWQSCDSPKAWLLGPGDGLKTVTMQLRDTSGKTQTVNDTITLNMSGGGLDSTYPVGLYVVAESSLINSNSTIKVSWHNATDHESNLLDIPLVYWYGVGNITNLTSALGWTYAGTLSNATISGLSLSQNISYYVVVKVVNSAGLDAHAISQGIIVDVTPPSAPGITSSSHAQQAWTNNNTVFFNWSASDNYGVNAYSYLIDQANATDPDTIPEYDSNTTYSGLGDGIFYFHVKARDNATNWGNASQHIIYIDVTAPPAPTMITLPQTTVNSTSITFNWTASSDISGINNYYLEIGTNASGNNTFAAKVGNVTGYTISTLTPNLTYYAKVKAQNNASIWSLSSDVVSGTVDISPPVILLKKPSGTVVSGTIDIVIETNKDSTCKYKNATQASFTDFLFTGNKHHEQRVYHPSGSQTYSLRCVDAVGNYVDTSTSFTVSSTAPDTVTDVSNQSILTGERTNVHVSVTNGGTGLGEIRGSGFGIIATCDTIARIYDFTIVDLGRGYYNVSFIAPKKTGACVINISSGNAALLKTVSVGNLSLAVQYSGNIGNTSATPRIVSGTAGNYLLGIASDSKTSSTSASANNLKLIENSAEGRAYVFITAQGADIGAKDEYLRTGNFLELINPSFGKILDKDKYDASAVITYSDIMILGNKTLSTGKHSVLIKNAGYNSTANKTMIQVRTA